MDVTMEINIAVLIVNSVAALFAVIAAIIAVVVYRKSAKLQKRSIDVSLFDMRTEILTEIIHKNFGFEKTRAKMLFNDEIAGLIDKYDKESAESTRNKLLRQEYLDVVRQRLFDDQYEYDVIDDFLKQIQDYEAMKYKEVSEELYKQMRKSIRSRRLCRKWRYGASPEVAEYVDYISVDDENTRHDTELESIQKELQEKMKQFIETSIQ